MYSNSFVFQTTVCKKIMERFGANNRVVCIPQDAFYRPLNEEEAARASKGAFNFDHPDAFDNEMITETLERILAGQSCEIPKYDYVNNSRFVARILNYANLSHGNLFSYCTSFHILKRYIHFTYIYKSEKVDYYLVHGHQLNYKGQNIEDH